jgi:hypothetical protein
VSLVIAYETLKELEVDDIVSARHNCTLMSYSDVAQRGERLVKHARCWLMLAESL